MEVSGIFAEQEVECAVEGIGVLFTLLDELGHGGLKGGVESKAEGYFLLQVGCGWIEFLPLVIVKSLQDGYDRQDFLLTLGVGFLA